MKKVFIMALLAVFVVTAAYEAPVKPIGSAKKHEFNKQVAAPSRISTDKYDAVVFNVHGTLVKDFYSKDGDYLGTTKTFAYDKLPAKALSIMNAKYAYPSYELKDCIKSKDADGVISYYVAFRKGNKNLVLEISHNGNVNVCDAV